MAVLRNFLEVHTWLSWKFREVLGSSEKSQSKGVSLVPKIDIKITKNNEFGTVILKFRYE